MTKYAELLRDPRWQKKRLEIMSRDNFTCSICQNSEKTLNVHHCYYRSGAMPWEYPERSLVTLCEACHEKETQFLKIKRAELQDELGKLGAMSIHYHELAAAFTDLEDVNLYHLILFIQFMLKDRTLLNSYLAAIAQGEDEALAASDSVLTHG